MFISSISLRVRPTGTAPESYVLYARLVPVSYTHLDVYKRQHCPLLPQTQNVAAALAEYPLDLAVIAFQQALGNIRLNGACKAAALQDVYKRQPVHRFRELLVREQQLF